jgi:GTP-binding protein
MDSFAIERERGLTILAKNTSIEYHGVRINIVDTPGHADFGGEVERTLAMVDGVLLLVDASEGPMPQTRFVLRKALERGLAPIVCINKIDRADARIGEVLDEVYALFIDLDANDEQLEFPVVYANARAGTARLSIDDSGEDLVPLFDLILTSLPGPEVDELAPTRFQANNLDYDDYVGRLALGRIHTGSSSPERPTSSAGPTAARASAKVTRLFGWSGLKRVRSSERGPATSSRSRGSTTSASATRSPTASGRRAPGPPHRRAHDHHDLRGEHVALGGARGTYVTSRKLRERLVNEGRRNVGLRIEDGESADRLQVAGRGELQLAILIETLRREGYELEVSKPTVVTRVDAAGQLLEPMEIAVIDVQEDFVGVVSQLLAMRKGVMSHMSPPASGRVRLEFSVPSRGLIGFRSQFLTDTRGTGIINAIFDGYGRWAGEIQRRSNGALVADREGAATPYAMFHLQERGTMFVPPGTRVYEGMVIGEYSRSGDLDVNVCREKKLTNIRAAGHDEAIRLTPEPAGRARGRPRLDLRRGARRGHPRLDPAAEARPPRRAAPQAEEGVVLSQGRR